jgi:alanyl aminopeptidase
VVSAGSLESGPLPLLLPLGASLPPEGRYVARPMKGSRRLLQLLTLTLLAIGFLGCGSGMSSGMGSGWIAAAEGDLDGNRRLGRGVVPRSYRLDLRIDPSRDRFFGKGQIDVEVATTTSTILLHASGLEFSRARVEQGGRLLEGSHELGKNGAMALRLSQTVKPGRATLHFAWEGPLPETPFGVYRVEDDGRWYVFTQFEPLEARKAFPGFDQPEFKTPFSVTLRVPTGVLALGNGPEIEHRSEPDAEVYVFAETKPLPTYLVAFAVGEFDVVEGGEAPPTRLVATRGKGELSGYALDRTPLILEWLTAYFDHPFPFAKLDLVAVPNFGVGAMENVGLVTFRERLLLLDRERAPVWSRRSSQSVIAHELAHMWYGNLVTMAWWDDLWLNESFATWMAAKVLADIDPELESSLDAIPYAQYTMLLDSKRDARQVRQPIRDGGDVYNAFDGITYGKGAAVLRMIEAWIGEEAFRTGVRAYMASHPYGSGGTEELLAALEAASGRPVARTIKWFLDQPGTPLVHVEKRCGDDAAPSLRLTQTRALPAGSDADIGEPWVVPVCMAFGTGDPAAPRARECFLLEGREQDVTLTTVSTCPVWVHPNEGERGYYRWSLAADDLLELVVRHKSELEVSERIALPGHYGALLEAGVLPLAHYMDALAVLASDERRQVVGAAAGALTRLYDVAIADSASSEAAAFGAALRAMLAPQLDSIGVLPSAGESTDARLRRASVLPALANVGRDPWIRTRARSVTESFIADPTSADEETLGLLLPIAAIDGDEELWKALVALVANPPSPALRSTLVRSLARFENPKLLRRSFDLLLDGGLRAQDYRTLAGRVPAARRRVAWAWLEDHYAELLPLLGPMTATEIPEIASGLCTKADHERVAAFFAAAKDAPAGTARNAGLVVEDIARCARLRSAIQPELAASLGRLTAD